MSGHDQAQRSPDAPVAAQPLTEQDRTDAFIHPSVGRLNALAMTHSTAPIGDITDILRRHPEDYDASMRAIHRLWGNDVALRCSILVPHVSMGAIGLGGPGLGGGPLGAPPPAREGGGTESPVTLDATRETPNGPVTTSASAGPVTGSVTTTPTNPHTGEPSRVTGGGVEVAGDVGPNTRASGGVSTEQGDEGRTVTATGSVTHRVGDNVTVGTTASVEGNTDTGEVRAQGGASVRIRTSDRTMLMAQGLVDTHGNLTHRIEFSVFRDRVNRLPLTDEGRSQILSLYLQGSTGPLIGQEQPFAPQVEGGITIRIPGT